MKFLSLALLFSLSSFAAEVAQVDDTKSGEVQISFTEDSLYASLDKAWLSHNCKSRFHYVGAVKETLVPKACRAEVIKFLLNNGYKPLDTFGRTFSR